MDEFNQGFLCGLAVFLIFAACVVYMLHIDEKRDRKKIHKLLFAKRLAVKRHAEFCELIIAQGGNPLAADFDLFYVGWVSAIDAAMSAQGSNG